MPPLKSITFTPRLTFLILLACVMAGCSGFKQKLETMQPPQVSLSSLALKSMNPLAPSFLVRLRLDNPNDLDLNLDGADAELSLNGKPVAAGISRSPLKLASRGSSDIDVEVTAQTLSILGQLLSLQQKEEISYGVSGHVSVVNWLGKLGAIPFSTQGSITRQELFKTLGASGF